MRIPDYCKPVDTWSPDQVRQFLNEKSPQEYNLVDVRTPKEYEEKEEKAKKIFDSRQYFKETGHSLPGRRNS
jgi:3-mercaptopyruvate sulfurtransferase SseA